MTAPHTAPASDPDGSTPGKASPKGSGLRPDLAGTPDAIMARILDLQRERRRFEADAVGWDGQAAAGRRRELRTKEDRLWREWAAARKRATGTP